MAIDPFLGIYQEEYLILFQFYTLGEMLGILYQQLLGSNMLRFALLLSWSRLK
jgi:hypothetical protein